MPDRPNVLIIICDDLAWGDLSLHGNPHLQTPNLDRLGHASARMTRYCSGPLCTPARAALMTGRHPYRTRAIDTYLGRSIIDPAERTLAQLLGEAGYRTGIFGKWHLGDCHPCRATDLGFQKSLVHLGGGLGQPPATGRSSYFHPEVCEDDQPRRVTGFCTDLFTDAADAWMGDGKAAGGAREAAPFFAYVAFNAPHSPVEVAEKWIQPAWREELPDATARLYGLVANIDHNVGRMIDGLEARGQRENTIVLFTSDHGPCPSVNVNGQPRWNAGLRSIKGTMYEGGIKVPALWSWPGRFEADHETSALSNPIDVMPTVADCCGVALPADRVIDGLSQRAALEGSGADLRAASEICMQWHRGDEPVRFRNAAVLTPRWKCYWPEREDAPELYDLHSDPSEETNLAAAEPERVAALKAVYEAWFDDVSAERNDNYAPPPISLGHPAEPLTCLTWQDWRTPGSTVEGWNHATPGHWSVDVKEPGTYELTLDLVEPLAGVARVSIADQEADVPLSPRVLSYQLELPLPAGATRLGAVVTPAGGSAAVGVKTVWVRRVPGG